MSAPEGYVPPSVPLTDEMMCDLYARICRDLDRRLRADPELRFLNHDELEMSIEFHIGHSFDAETTRLGIENPYL